jgi:hypothetical protein
MQYPDQGMQNRVSERLEKISNAKRMTGFEKLQTRGTSNLAIGRLQYSRLMKSTLILALVGRKDIPNQLESTSPYLTWGLCE